MKTWFTADHHFGHARVIELSRRPFADASDMRRGLVERWNAVVGSADDIWHLGDFAYRGEPGETETTFAALAGRKHLVVGNHDGPETRALGWASVHEIAEISVDSIRVVLCHYPMLEWPHYYRQAVHLFGHVHGNRRGVGRSCDVGVDCWGYRPVRLRDVLQRLGDARNE